MKLNHADNTFCEAIFRRGTGLGNRLFTWARCRKFSLEYSVPMLAPVWERLAVGALVRGGIDRSNYLHQIALVDVFQNSDLIAGFRQMRIKAKAEVIEVIQEAEQTINALAGFHSTRLIRFIGEGAEFATLNGSNTTLFREFRKIVKPKWVILSEAPNAVIGINIRRGKDFRDAQHPSDYQLKGSLRTPLRWFVDSVKWIRARLGFEAPALVVLDGTAEDLRDILSLGGLSLLRPGCAASDLLALSRTKILVGSGGSSFSAWASYFGQMPTISILGQSLRWFKLDHGPSVYVGEFDPSRPSPLLEANIESIRCSMDSHIRENAAVCGQDRC